MGEWIACSYLRFPRLAAWLSFLMVAFVFVYYIIGDISERGSGRHKKLADCAVYVTDF